MPDISHTLVAKSDQLNAADLAQPITVTIDRCEVRSDPKQPVLVYIRGGDYKPWKPCKVVRRLLAGQWGTNTDDWHGKHVTLYNEPKVKYGGVAQGGIRVRAMSHIREAFKYPARESQKVVEVYSISKLPDVLQQRNDIDADEARARFLDGAKERHGLTREQIDAWLAGDCDAGPVSEQSPDALRAIFRDLGKCRAWVDAQNQPTEPDNGDGWEDAGEGGGGAR